LSCQGSVRPRSGLPWMMVRHRLRNLSLHCMLFLLARRGSCSSSSSHKSVLQWWSEAAEA
jgi:hypothetical protein